MVGPPKFPNWWFDRSLNINAAATIIAVPYDSCYRWYQLTRATGLFFGEKRGREILLDTHEIYLLRILAALHRLRLPVGPQEIRAVLQFAFDPDGRPAIPETDFEIRAPDAMITVRARRIFQVLADALDPAHNEEAADAESN